jgi:glycosyltransferase involved in cell wall biosynthesis
MKSDSLAGAGTLLNRPIGTEMSRERQPVGRPTPFRQRLRRWFWHASARQSMLLPLFALMVARLIGRRRRSVPRDGCEILLTGRFDSANWILAHLGPLSASESCARLWMVSTNPVPALPNVGAIYPPKWLIRITGTTPARLLTFLWAAVRKRPHIVGGFHIMVNGIAAVIVRRLTGARSMYFCVGGPAEVRHGGIHGADSCFIKMETADLVVERRLLRIVAQSDIVITMGTRAVRFFREKGIHTDFHVVSGGIDPVRFRPARKAPSYHLILTGRLVGVKRIDVFLQTVRQVANRIPDVKAVIVGDGELRDELQAQCADLGINHQVDFVGRHNDVENWLRRAGIFVLTSDSEGLSLSLMEAMMSGLPAVVSDVGDLGDLVENGLNGYRVPRRCPELFADRLVELLSNTEKLHAFSRAARRSALAYETQATIHRWDNLLAGCGGA